MKLSGTLEKSIEALDLQPSQGESDVREWFQDLAKALTQKLTFGTQSSEVRIEPGYRVNMGQQLNIVAVVPARSFRDVLFRAYVPAAGFPATVDFFGEELTYCDSFGDLERHVGDFLRDPVVKGRLAMIRDLITA